MSLAEAIDSGQNVLLQVNSRDLIAFGNLIAHQVLEHHEKEMKQKDGDRFFTTDEAAARLRINRKTLWKWVRAGIIKEHKVGGRNFYKESELDKVI